MIHILAALYFTKVVRAFEGLVVVSKHTSLSLAQELQEATARDSEISFAYYSAGLFESGVVPDVVFDFTSASLPSFNLKLAAESQKFLLFRPYPSDSVSSSPWVYYLHPSHDTEAEALSALLRNLAWEPVHLMYSHEAKSETLAASIRDLAVDSVIVPDYGADTIYQSFIGKTVKPSANWRIVSTHAGKGVSKVLANIKKHRIDRERAAWLFASRSIWNEFITGAVVLVEEDLETAESEGHYEFLAAKRSLNIIKALPQSQASKVIPERLRDQLAELLPGKVVSSEYVIVNYYASENQQKIGRVTGTTVEWSGRLVYPGNVTELNTSTPTLHISGNLVPVNGDGTFSLTGYILSVAIPPMLSLVNADDSLLENFRLELFVTDCGIDFVTYSGAYTCFEQYVDNLGLLFLDGNIDNTLDINLKVQEELGVRIPHIGMGTQNPEFYYTASYPRLVMISPYDVYNYSITPSILKGFGWKNIIAFFQANYIGENADAFLASAAQQGLKILNSAEHRYLTIPDDYETFFAENKVHLEHAISTNGKIIFSSLDYPANHWLFEALYDLGVRSGDFMVFGFRRLSSIMLQGTDEDTKYKTLEIADGSLALMFGEYVGDYGEQLEAIIAEAIAPMSTDWTCYQIETLMLGVQALNMMLTLGRDYEDNQLLNEYIRMQRYTGCTGPVSIDGEGNGRSQSTFKIFNFYKVEDSWGETVVGSYTMGITVPLVYTEPIVWPLGSTEVPEDMKQTEFDCGFDLAVASENQTSFLLSRLLFAGLVTIAVFVSVGSYARMKRQDPEELSEPKPMMFEDAMVLFLPIAETLQIIGLGPSVWNLNPYLAMLCSAVMVDFKLVRVIQNWAYAYYAASSLAGVCMLCSFLLVLGRRCRLPNLMKSAANIVCLKQYHICWQIGLVTALSLLASILKCDQSATESFEDSFADVKCTLQCWSGEHLIYTELSSSLIVSYLILASIFRPIAEDYVSYSSVKTMRLYSLTSTLFKGSLVAVSFSFKHFNWFPYLYSALIWVWTIYSLVMKPYNYPRLCHWQRMLNLGLAFNQPLLLVELNNGPGIELIVLHAIICVGIGILGIILQVKKYPSLLKRKPGSNIAKLFQFQLGSRVKAKDLTEHQLDYRYRIPESVLPRSSAELNDSKSK